jgi:hypothetical protein
MSGINATRLVSITRRPDLAFLSSQADVISSANPSDNAIR